MRQLLIIEFANSMSTSIGIIYDTHFFPVSHVEMLQLFTVQLAATHFHFTLNNAMFRSFNYSPLVQFVYCFAIIICKLKLVTINENISRTCQTGVAYIPWEFGLIKLYWNREADIDILSCKLKQQLGWEHKERLWESSCFYAANLKKCSMVIFAGQRIVLCFYLL